MRTKSIPVGTRSLEGRDDPMATSSNTISLWGFEAFLEQDVARRIGTIFGVG